MCKSCHHKQQEDQDDDPSATSRNEPVAILAEAALSYLGLGAQPPLASWGRMLADAQPWLYRAPLLAVFPGLAVALSVLGLNLVGDGLRDALDPKLRARR